MKGNSNKNSSNIFVKIFNVFKISIALLTKPVILVIKFFVLYFKYIFIGLYAFIKGIFVFIKYLFMYFFIGLKGILEAILFIISFPFNKKDRHNKQKVTTKNNVDTNYIKSTISEEKLNKKYELLRLKEQKRLEKIKEYEEKNIKESLKKAEKLKIINDKILKKQLLKRQKREKRELENSKKQEELRLKKLKKQELKNLKLQEKREILRKKEEKRKIENAKKAEILKIKELKKQEILKQREEQNKVKNAKKLEIKRINEINRQEKLRKKEELREKQDKLKSEIKEEKKRKKEEKLSLRREKDLEKEKAKLLKQKQVEQLLIKKNEIKNKIYSDKKQKEAEKKEIAKKIKEAKEASKIKQKKEKKTLEEKLKNWYNNLTFVKYKNNKNELKREVLLMDYEGSDAVRSEEKLIYKYTAKKIETGKVEKGQLSAYSKLDVHSYLISEGFEIYEITAHKQSKGLFLSLAIASSKMKRNDLVFFLTQLSTFLKSGLPLLDSVKILEKQTKKRNNKLLFRALIYELTLGENFSDALSKQGDAFPKLLVNMIKSSELTGDLAEVLNEMASYYEETEKVRKQMVSAMTYPAVIFVFATIIIVFIMIYVIPEFVGIYADIGSDLPGITLFIISLSSFIQNNILYLLIGIVVFIILFRVLYKSIKVFRTLVQWVMMHIPVIGKILIYNEVTMFTKTFGSLLNHNVFITDSMEVLRKITNNEVYKMLIFDTITNLSKGDDISSSFKNHWAFPIIAYEMLLTGEKTGQLGDMMNKVANYYQIQHKNAVNQIKTFIEPIMIVFLTVIVGVILLSVILPMFNMYSMTGI